jgi:T6SS, Phospholipase effector Tle1-like, catalytic domain
MAAKCIILLLDGTWNDADLGARDTNIVRLREIIARSLDAKSTLTPPSINPLTTNSNQKLVTGRTFQDIEHYVFYERGVGTGPLLDRIKGGSFGDGLAGNIRRAYKFLSFSYQPGDHIFIFGFSRGAYTARSLVGYIAAAGLLKRENCTQELERKAWEYYRTAPNDRMPGIWTELTPWVNDRDALKIDCLGVFDTVGALGVPLTPFRRVNRERYEFHNVNLSAITKVNLHAVAMDEHRQPFEATIWRKPKFRSFATVTEQVWFPGSHSDVGGGYFDEKRRLKKHPQALDDLTLDWMLKRLIFYFPNFPFNKSCWKKIAPGWAAASQHEARTWFYRMIPRALRSISNCPVQVKAWRYEREVSRNRHDETIGEMIHISVIERLGRPIRGRLWKRKYKPQNFVNMLDAVKHTYGMLKDPAADEPSIQIVGWDGKPFDPKVDADRRSASQLLNAATQRLA